MRLEDDSMRVLQVQLCFLRSAISRQAEQHLRPRPPPNRVIAEDLSPLRGDDHSPISSMSTSGYGPGRLPVSLAFSCERYEVTGAQH